MYKQTQSIHFVGIGGVGMAGIAEVLINLGYCVSGSDLKESELTINLSKLGAKIYYGHKEENISDNIEIMVLSSAIKEDNPELLEGRKKQLVIIPRAEMLAELMRMKYGIAVAGSHGKTSTTSMTSKVLQDLRFDPTVIIGGRVLTQMTGASVGTGEYLLAEADESDGSFCLLKPAIAIVTNIDTEHMTYYSSFGALEEAFLSFMNSVPFYGLVVICGDDPVLNNMVPKLKRRHVTFGLSPGLDISATNIEIKGWHSSYDLLVKGKNVGRVNLPVPGKHMVSNSLATVAVALELGCDINQLIESLGKFPGVARRTEFIGYVGDTQKTPHSTILIDDYGHHPSEIRATLQGIREGILSQQIDTARLILVFQPHRYTRTRELFTEFLTAFDDADLVLISDIYSAGEDPIDGINSEVLVSSISHKMCEYIGNIDNAKGILKQNILPGDVIVTMGAGSVGKFSISLFNHLNTVQSELGQSCH